MLVSIGLPDAGFRMLPMQGVPFQVHAYCIKGSVYAGLARGP